MAAPKGNKFAVGHGAPTKYEGEKTDKMVFEFASKNPVIDMQIAEFLKVNVDTIHEWKKVHPSFSDSLSKAKEIIDEKVVSSLFRSANGGKKKTVMKKPVFNENTGKHEMVVVQEIEEDVIPNATACFFWLKNRDPNRWREKQDVEVHNESVIKIEKNEENL